MRKAITLCVLAMAILRPGQVLAVDCEYAFTGLERAICSNSELEQIDRELTRLSAKAIQEKSTSPHAISQMRNMLALRCGASDQIAACLITQGRKAIRGLQTVHIVEVPASYKPTAKEMAMRLIELEKEQQLLHRQLTTGCNDSQRRKHLQAVLREQGLSCARLTVLEDE